MENKYWIVTQFITWTSLSLPTLLKMPIITTSRKEAHRSGSFHKYCQLCGLFLGRDIVLHCGLAEENKSIRYGLVTP